ncbi:MAG TPA: glycosyltransferase family 4 protein, partial [Gaiellaceae bacterium]|nr:glycosyltransferase family 4 protein [Gaiellaceae bacterium]
MAATAPAPPLALPRDAAPARPRPRVVHFTTSYPRHEGDFAGRFVKDLVERLEEAGLDVDVLAPGAYRDWGLAYGAGVVGNLRRRPWRAPLLAVSMVRALRRAARGADLVHAHWLAGGAVAALARTRFVVTLHGSGTAGRLSDLELARRAPRLVRAILQRAETVICVSEALGEMARAHGARDVRVIPNGVTLPDRATPEPAEPSILYAGRLSPEKGIADLVDAARGLPLVVAGDGPLRHLVPDALGFVPHDELERLYDEAAVVVLPSHREGLPLAVLEAMAHGRPVVATRVGGIPELVEDGVTGLLVEPGDRAGLRAALERVLADADLRRRLGAEARRR